MSDSLEKLVAETLALKTDLKTCTGCKLDKPESSFHFTSLSRSDKKLGIRRRKAQCIECTAKSWATWSGANREQLRKKDREKHYTKKYGLEPSIAKLMSDAKNRTGVCPICSQTKVLVMDHDHDTQANRDWICSNCNSMLGMAKDNIGILYGAIFYLKKHRGI